MSYERIPGLDAWLTREPPEPDCEICWLPLNACSCQECPVCGDVGELACYANFNAGRDHGLIVTENQRARRREVQWDVEMENKMWADLYEDELERGK